MTDMIKRDGSCLCGAVRISANNTSKDMGACHCDMCRKWGGGPLMVVDCGTDISFSGADNIAVFKSSHWAERGFCKQCGSHLFYKLKESGQHMMPIGLFGDESTCTFAHQVFIEEKPSYYHFANETNDMTGAELFEKMIAK